MKMLGLCMLTCLLILPGSGRSQTAPLPDDAVLLILDVQPVFYTDQQEADLMIDRINRLTEQVPADKTAATQAAGQALNISLKGISKTQFPPSDMDPRLQLGNIPTYTKITPNALEQEELNQQLKALNAKAVVLCGLMAEQCVYHTAIGALKEGYTVYLIKDAVMGSTPKKKEKALKKLSKKGVIMY